MAESGYHLPVMVGEVVEYLDCGPGKLFVDATVGGGGHAAALLEASGPDGFLIGIDRDREALAETEKRLAGYEGRYLLAQGNFGELGSLLDRLGRTEVDGLLLDLGISSRQVDDRERGFSFRTEAALDMRMDQGEELTAERLIRESSEKELTDIIRTYGEEPRGRAIARAIHRAVEEGGALTTTGLAETIAAAGGRQPRGRRWIHPATRTFQALRIAVNREMEALESVMDQLPRILSPGGRCCCLSYHSLEDRIVKNTFRELAGRGPAKLEAVLEVLTKKPLRPGDEETRRNPRARSARFRAARKKEGL